MATVIDSLVVLLNLDATKFTTEQKKALEQLRKVEDGVGRGAKEIQSWGKKVEGSFALVRDSALRMLAVFTAGVGIKDFVRNTTDSAAAAGRLAYNIGASTKEVSTWAAAIRLFGGDSSAAQQSMFNLSQSIQEFALTGKSAIVPYLRSIGVDLVDPLTGKLKTLTQLYLDLSDVLSRNPQQGNYIGRMLGLDQGTINLLEKGRGAVQDYLNRARSAGVVDNEQAAQLQQLQTMIRELSQTLGSLGREVLVDIAPGINDFLHNMTEIIQKNPEMAKGFVELTTAVVGFSGAVIGLNAALAGTKAVFGGLAAVATGIPAWMGGVLAGVWAMWPKQLNKGEAEDLKKLGLSPGSAPAGSLSLFDLIQRLENSGPNSVSRAGAIGRNQIMPGTAAMYGFDPHRLTDPAYNDMVARAIEARLNERYHGDVDAISVAYNAGPMAADRWLRSGRNDAILPAETRAYLARERAMVGGGGATTITTTIGSIYVNAPNATNAAGIAGAMRSELQNHSLVVQGNGGPQ